MLKDKLLLLSECPIIPTELFHDWQVGKAFTPELARRVLSASGADLLMLQTGTRASQKDKILLECSLTHGVSGLLLCPSERMDSLSYQFREAPVMVVPLQTPRHVLIQILDYMKKNAGTTRRLNESLAREKQKLHDEKILSQTKLQLVHWCRWSEEKAHQYILKTAMDNSLTKAAACIQIQRRLEKLIEKNKKDAGDATA